MTYEGRAKAYFVRRQHLKMRALGFAVPSLGLLLVLTNCSGSPAQQEARFVAKGRQYLDAKDYDSAKIEFLNAIQLAPKEADLYYQLGLAELGKGARPQAAQALSTAANLDPGQPKYKTKLAELLALGTNRNDLQLAEKLANEAVNLLPGSPDALSALAITEWRLGNEQDAEGHLKEAMATGSKDLKPFLRLAGIKISKGDLEGAEDVFHEIARRVPMSAEGAVATGRFYLMRGRIDDAEAEFRRATVAHPEYAPALSDLAGVQFLKGRTDLAEASYRKLSTFTELEYQPLHALFLSRIGRRQEAIAEWETLVKRNHSEGSFQRGLIAALDGAGRRTDAIKLVNTLLDESPRNTDYLFQRACLNLESQNVAAAESDVNEVLRAKPAMAGAHYLMARIRKEEGMKESRTQELRESVRLSPALLRARVELAVDLTETGVAREALEVLELTPRWQKNSLAVAVQRNWALIKLEDWGRAKKSIDETLSLTQTSELLLQKGLVEAAQKNYAAAELALEKALAQNPGDIRILKGIVSAFDARNRRNEAVARVKHHADSHPESAAVQEYLGELLVSTGDLAGARTALASAQRIAPANPSVRVSVASLDLMQGNTLEARRALLSVASGPVSDAATISSHLLLAEVEQNTGNYAVAIEHYRQVLNADADNLKALNNAAYLLADQMGQPEDALKFAQRAKRLAPNDSSAIDTLAWVYYRMGQYETALTYLTVSRQPTAVQQYHLAMVYAKLGRADLGHAALSAGLRINPHLPEAAVARRLLSLNKNP